MKRNTMYYDTHAIKINKDSYRPGIHLFRFIRYIWCVLFKGESPIENRPGYARRSARY
ncbi:hypothetical protein [Flavihumibacter sp.]|uniref:hypothetical protein n=1 Tax=Flavihumibacter sp. TaxID=1913981 RepID=UPI002FC8F6D5